MRRTFLLLLLARPCFSAERLILYAGESRIVTVEGARKTEIGNHYFSSQHLL